MFLGENGKLANLLSAEYNEERLQNKMERGKKVKKLPSIAILGVKKCGTIALSKMLKMHPNLETPIDPEIWFWTMPKLLAKGLDYYKVKISKQKYILMHIIVVADAICRSISGSCSGHPWYTGQPPGYAILSKTSRSYT